MRERRSDIRIPISLLILVSEDLDGTQSFEGRTLNVSPHSMEVQIDGMDEERYGNISSKVGLVRVSLKNPNTDRQIRLSGFVVWSAYLKARDSSEPFRCNMGISFSESANPVGFPAYSNFVNRLTASDI